MKKYLACILFITAAFSLRAQTAPAIVTPDPETELSNTDKQNIQLLTDLGIQVDGQYDYFHSDQVYCRRELLRGSFISLSKVSWPVNGQRVSFHPTVLTIFLADAPHGAQNQPFRGSIFPTGRTIDDKNSGVPFLLFANTSERAFQLIMGKKNALLDLDVHEVIEGARGTLVSSDEQASASGISASQKK